MGFVDSQKPPLYMRRFLMFVSENVFVGKQKKDFCDTLFGRYVEKKLRMYK